MSRSRRTVVAVAAVTVLATGVAVWRQRHPIRRDSLSASASSVSHPTHAGSGACAGCHPVESARWRNSQHASAMAEASDRTVTGRFDGSRLTYAGITSTFFRRDGRYYVRTDGADGTLADFEIAYTFGVSPLQQYLVRFPGGRLQPLSIAWDTRPRSEGGQRWFHLYPRERIKAGDPLHWTGPAQNWNFMCADCHVTGLRKGFDPATREFHTAWSEISVGCEACHGPGSDHVARARSHAWRTRDDYGLTARLDERRGIRWHIDPAASTPVRSQPRATDREIEVCARCHSRRTQLTDQARPGDPLENGFRPSLLEPALFHSDGQQKDEVYTYASFLQSKMYAKGVTCSDCHDPHSGTIRLPGNAVCTQCHQSAKYDGPSHHFHVMGSAGAACAACHMPTATYMLIDARHDHSFRVPRPDESLKFGVPNACTMQCHVRQSAAWAVSAIERRSHRSPSGYQHFAGAFSDADRAVVTASAGLRQIAIDSTQPAIVRGSALERLGAAASLDAAAAAQLLGDSSPIVRRAALAALERADEATRLGLAPALLKDSIRTVRMQAAICLADLADRSLSGSVRADFDRAFDEFVAEQEFNADRPEAHANLGQVLVARGRTEAARSAFRAAIAIDSAFVPAYVNLADVYRAEGNESAAVDTLREAIRANPGSAALHHAIGLAFVRQHRMEDALDQLGQAVALDRTDARYSYVYGVALHDTGNAARALRILADSVARHPEDRDTLLALVTYADEAGRPDDSRRYVEKLLELDPNDQDARALAGRLKTGRPGGR